MITREGGHLALGIVIGAGALLLFLVYEPVVPLPFQLSDSIQGAIVGGLIAGAVAIGSQILLIIDTRDRRKREEIEDQKSIALTVFLKVRSFLDQITKRHNFYRTYDDKAVAIVKMRPGAASDLNNSEVLHKPLRGDRLRLRFSEQELSLLLRTKCTKLFNITQDLEANLASLYFLEDRYEAAFDRFFKSQAERGKLLIEGTHITSEAPADQLGLLELQDLLKNIRETVIPASRLANSALSEIVKLLQERYSTNIKMELRLDISGSA